MDNNVAIASAQDMCRLLQHSGREKAADFARAQHERACWNYDELRTEFWQDVLTALSASGAVSRMSAPKQAA